MTQAMPVLVGQKVTQTKNGGKGVKFRERKRTRFERPRHHPFSGRGIPIGAEVTFQDGQHSCSWVCLPVTKKKPLGVLVEFVERNLFRWFGEGDSKEWNPDGELGRLLKSVREFPRKREVGVYGDLVVYTNGQVVGVAFFFSKIQTQA